MLYHRGGESAERKIWNRLDGYSAFLLWTDYRKKKENRNLSTNGPDLECILPGMGCTKLIWHIREELVGKLNSAPVLEVHGRLRDGIGCSLLGKVLAVDYMTDGRSADREIPPPIASCPDRIAVLVLSMHDDGILRPVHRKNLFGDRACSTS